MRTQKRISYRRRQSDWSTNTDLSKELWRINWKALGYPYCGIYAISPDNKWPTKIGISTNPTYRIQSLQTACWRKLDVCEYFFVEDFKAAEMVEAKAHEMLTGLRLNGEWFDIRPDKASEVIRFAADVLAVELRNEIPGEFKLALNDALLRMNSNYKGLSTRKLPTGDGLTSPNKSGTNIKS